MKKGLLALAGTLLVIAAIAPLLAENRAAARDKPLMLRFGAADVYEIRTQGMVGAYRAVVDGQVVDEGTLTRGQTDRFFIHVHNGNPHDVSFNFGDTEHGLLNPQFPGIQNQCSGSTLTLPTAQPIDLSAGWTSIYRLTVTDACASTESTLDIQIK